MKSITIQGQKRESVGKKSTKALRDAELVPCVVYGGKEPINFSATEKSFKNLVYTPDAHTVELVINGENYPSCSSRYSIPPNYRQNSPRRFLSTFCWQTSYYGSSCKITGRAKGVVAGGVLRQSFRKLKVKAVPANLPDEIVVDVTPLRIGNKLYIGDIKNDAYTFMHPDNAVIAAVKMSRNAMKNGASAAGDDDE